MVSICISYDTLAVSVIGNTSESGFNIRIYYFTWSNTWGWNRFCLRFSGPVNAIKYPSSPSLSTLLSSVGFFSSYVSNSFKCQNQRAKMVNVLVLGLLLWVREASHLFTSQWLEEHHICIPYPGLRRESPYSCFHLTRVSPGLRKGQSFPQRT